MVARVTWGKEGGESCWKTLSLQRTIKNRKMKKLVCPQCKIAAMYVKNEAGERRLVYVTSEGEVVPKKEDESLEGFNLEEVFCLGCSWHGSPKRLVRY